MPRDTNKSIIADLWNRRVPQLVATYVGICWSILQFLLFTTNRYEMNASLDDKFMDNAYNYNIAASPQEPKIGSAFQQLQYGSHYAIMGQEERIWEIGDIIKENAPQLQATYDCVANFLISIITEDKKDIEQQLNS